MPEHRCTKDEVEWVDEPTPGGSHGDGNRIEWHGRCSCGREVFERYVQEDELFDAESGEELK